MSRLKLATHLLSEALFRSTKTFISWRVNIAQCFVDECPAEFPLTPKAFEETIQSVARAGAVKFLNTITPYHAGDGVKTVYEAIKLRTAFNRITSDRARWEFIFAHPTKLKVLIDNDAVQLIFIPDKTCTHTEDEGIINEAAELNTFDDYGYTALNTLLGVIGIKSDFV